MRRGFAPLLLRQNPVKYQLMKVSVPNEAAVAGRWVPGQAFRAVLHLRDADAGISVPNVALRTRGGESFGFVRAGAAFEKRVVELGACGQARSEVVQGLRDGDAVVLTPEQVPEQGG